MNDAISWSDYARALAQVMGLCVEDVALERAAAQLQLTALIAKPLLALELPEHVDGAGVFEA